MKYSQLWLVVVVGWASVSFASAEAVNPFSLTLADLQALADNTSGFSSGNQLSTVDAIHFAPDGIHVEVTWRVGQFDDPFGENFGETFSRVVLTRYTTSEDGGLGRLLSPPYDGIQWSIMSDMPINGQPYIESAPNGTYYQSANTFPVPGDMSSTMVTLSFDDARNFVGIEPNTIVHPDGNGEIRSNALGLQLYAAFILTPGQAVPGHIWISHEIPEPSAVVLGALANAGLLVWRRKRSSRLT